MTTTLREHLEQQTSIRIKQALRDNGCSRAATAAELGINRHTLWHLMKKHEILVISEAKLNIEVTPEVAAGENRT